MIGRLVWVSFLIGIMANTVLALPAEQALPSLTPEEARESSVIVNLANEYARLIGEAQKRLKVLEELQSELRGRAFQFNLDTLRNHNLDSAKHYVDFAAGSVKKIPDQRSEPEEKK